jgi:hypothetical protein
MSILKQIFAYIAPHLVTLLLGAGIVSYYIYHQKIVIPPNDPKVAADIASLKKQAAQLDKRTTAIEQGTDEAVKKGEKDPVKYWSSN